MMHIKGVSVSEASFIMSLGLAARGISTLLFFPYLSGKFSDESLIKRRQNRDASRTFMLYSR